MTNSPVEGHEFPYLSPDTSLRPKAQGYQAIHDLTLQQDQEREEESLLSTNEGGILESYESGFHSELNTNLIPGNGHSWRPLHARPLVIIAFSAWFLVLIMALTVLNRVSQRNQGLFESTNELQYIWRYTPLAVLTLTTSLWGLVDYDVRVTAPWNQMKIPSDHQPLHEKSHILLLDYIGMSSFKVPLQSFRNAHFAVLGSAIIFILLQCQTVISAGLFSVSRIEMADQKIPIILTSEFSDSHSKDLKETSNLAMSTMLNTLTGESGFPDGCSDRWAYQTFSTTSPGITTSEVVVDALTYGLTCEPGNVTVTSLGSTLVSNDGEGAMGDFGGLQFQFGDCEFHADTGGLSGTRNGTNTEHWWTFILKSGFVPGHCNSSELDHSRVVVSLTTIDYVVSSTHNQSLNVSEDSMWAHGVNYTYRAERIQSTTVVCAGIYNFTTVAIQTRNATQQIIPMEVAAPRRTLPSFHPWTIIEAANKDTPSMMNILPSRLEACGGNCSTVTHWDEYLLSSAFNEYYRRYAVFYWHNAITNPANITTIGEGTIVADRLVVQDLACQFIVGSSSLCILILIGFGVKISKSHEFPFRVGSLWSIAALAGRFGLSAFSHDLGGTDQKQLKVGVKRLQHEAPHVDPPKAPRLVEPWSLRSMSRIGILLYILLLIVALEAILHRSHQMKGLGDIVDNPYLHYTWTTGPTVIMTVLSLAISSVDFQTRMLGPFISLTRTAPFETLDMDLLRPFWPAILKQEWQLRNAGSLATTAANLITAYLTIASAFLFHEEPATSTSELQIQSDSYFVTSGRWYFNYQGFDGSEILMGNKSYTATSWENIVFPTLSLNSAAWRSDQFNLNATQIPISATIQALRPSLSACYLFPTAEIETNRIQQANVTVFLDDQSDETQSVMDVITVTVQGESLKDCPWREGSWELDVEGDFTATFPVPLSADSQFGAAQRRCSSYLFIWGRHSPGNPASSSTSALRCNQTAGDVVSIASNFIGSNLTLDLAHPPQPLNATSIWNSTTRLSIQELGIEWFTMEKGADYSVGVTTSVFDMPLEELYLMLESPSTPKNSSFDGFFSQLVTSRYAVPRGSIGDIQQEGAVRDAILFQHGILAARALDGIGRISDLQSLNTTDYQIGYTPVAALGTSVFEPRLFDATLTYENGQLRLVLDEKATRILQGLLGLTMLLFLSGYVLAHRKPVLPRDPTSIASALALLAGGDILELMYKDEVNEAMAIEDLKQTLGADCRIWIGTGPHARSVKALSGSKRFGVWTVTGSARNLEKTARPSNEEREGA